MYALKKDRDHMQHILATLEYNAALNYSNRSIYTTSMWEVDGRALEIGE